MEPIYGPAGELIAWRFRDVLYDQAGEAVGFVHGHGVYARDGSCTGWFEDGIYRDPSGSVIGYEEEATGGLLLPIPNRPAVPPVPALRPALPPFACPREPRVRKMSWAAAALDALL